MNDFIIFWYSFNMTLSEFSLQIRIMAKLLLVTVVALIFFYLLVLLLLSLVRKPATLDLKIDPVYGSIKAPVFEQALPNQDYEYVLDTIDGEFPETTASAMVYFIPKPASTLAYLNKIESLAQSFDFDTSVYQPQTLSEEWVKYEDQERILEINIVSFNFRFYYKAGSSELHSLIEATPEANFTQMEDDFINKAMDSFVSKDSYPGYLAAGTTNPVFQKYDYTDKRFVPCQEGGVPQAVRVDFFREDEALSVFSPKYFESQNYAILAPLSYYAKVVQMEFLGYEKLEEKPGVYPLLTSEEAFSKLKKGQASIISVKEPSDKTIKIKKISLGYYNPETYQPYFQPVFVFLSSDNNFVAYLPAVKDEYLLK
jgi:hypothetical protein